jgi:hypothetical protein
MTGRNPAGIEDFPSPGCSDVAHGPQRLNTIIGAYEAFLDPVCGTDDLSFHLVLELPATETPPARRHPPAPLPAGHLLAARGAWLAVLARPATAGVRMKSRTVLIAVASSWLRAHGLISAGVTHVG